jgi:hypothetical protein
MPRAPRRPPPDPVDVDAVPIVWVGTLLWAAVFVGLLPFSGWLHRTGHLWWLWTALVGSLLGVWGLVYTRRRRAALRRAATPGLASPPHPPPEAGPPPPLG